MKCGSLNHFYAINSVSHLCLDKVTFISVSTNALNTLRTGDADLHF